MQTAGGALAVVELRREECILKGWRGWIAVSVRLGLSIATEGSARGEFGLCAATLISCVQVIVPQGPLVVRNPLVKGLKVV